MRGLKVGLIDRRGVGLETSYGNAGVIGNSYIMAFSFPEPRQMLDVLLDRDTSARIRYSSLPRFLPWLLDFYLESCPKKRAQNGRSVWPLLRSAVEEHRFLMQNTGAERHIHSTGRVSLFRNDDLFADGETERALARELGVAYEVMDGSQFREVEPHIKPAFSKVVRWTGSPRLDNPGAVMAAYGERFVRDGGTLLIEDVKALQLSTNDKWVVTTAQGTAETARVVMCLGPWSKDILQPMGYHFPMAPKRGYHQHYRAEGGATFHHAITDVQWGYVMAPMEQGLRITTGAEMVDHDAPPQPKQLAMLLPHARELYPLGEPIGGQPWYGSRPCFADSLPVIGESPRHQGLWFNFGHGHLGLTLGPSTGRLVAEMMMRTQTFCDPIPYRPERFKI